MCDEIFFITPSKIDIDPENDYHEDCLPFGVVTFHWLSHMLHVWHIYLHLASIYGKCM